MAIKSRSDCRKSFSGRYRRCTAICRFSAVLAHRPELECVWSRVMIGARDRGPFAVVQRVIIFHPQLPVYSPVFLFAEFSDSFHIVASPSGVILAMLNNPARSTSGLLAVNFVAQQTAFGPGALVLIFPCLLLIAGVSSLKR